MEGGLVGQRKGLGVRSITYGGLTVRGEDEAMVGVVAVAAEVEAAPLQR